MKPPSGRDDLDDHGQRRAAMVLEQLLGRGFTDAPVISAMSRVPRHLFVPRPWRWAAYRDRPLPIGSGQTISQPYVVALMAELAAVESTDRVG